MALNRHTFCFAASSVERCQEKPVLRLRLLLKGTSICSKPRRRPQRGAMSIRLAAVAPTTSINNNNSIHTWYVFKNRNVSFAPYVHVPARIESLGLLPNGILRVSMLRTPDISGDVESRTTEDIISDRIWWVSASVVSSSSSSRRGVLR